MDIVIIWFLLGIIVGSFVTWRLILHVISTIDHIESIKRKEANQ